MTTDRALQIVEDLPKTVADLATQIEFRGAEELIEMLEKAGVDGEEFLFALEDELIENAARDFIAEAVRREMEALREGPLPTDTEIEFGKYSGKTVEEIAHEDPGYAEWAAENLDDKPRLAAAFEEALK